VIGSHHVDAFTTTDTPLMVLLVSSEGYEYKPFSFNDDFSSSFHVSPSDFQVKMRAAFQTCLTAANDNVRDNPESLESSEFILRFFSKNSESYAQTSK
jgi:hypothetical protein